MMTFGITFKKDVKKINFSVTTINFEGTCYFKIHNDNHNISMTAHNTIAINLSEDTIGYFVCENVKNASSVIFKNFIME